MTDREIMQQALEALEYHVAQTRPIHLTSEVIHALRSRLAQPEKEPAALVINGVLVKSELPEKYTGHLYTAPPQRKPLTDDECDAIYTALDAWAKEVDVDDFGLPTIAGGGMRAGRAIIRAAHGIKENT